MEKITRLEDKTRKILSHRLGRIEDHMYSCDEPFNRCYISKNEFSQAFFNTECREGKRLWKRYHTQQQRLINLQKLVDSRLKV